MYSADSGIVERGASVWFRSCLDLGAIYDWRVLVRRELTLERHGVAVLSEEFADVALHGKAASTFCIVPFEVYACELFTFPIFRDFVVFLEDIAKVVGMAFSYIFDSKIINYEGEEDWAPFVEP